MLSHLQEAHVQLLRPEDNGGIIKAGNLKFLVIPDTTNTLGS